MRAGLAGVLAAGAVLLVLGGPARGGETARAAAPARGVRRADAAPHGGRPRAVRADGLRQLPPAGGGRRHRPGRARPRRGPAQLRRRDAAREDRRSVPRRHERVVRSRCRGVRLADERRGARRSSSRSCSPRRAIDGAATGLGFDTVPPPWAPANRSGSRSRRPGGSCSNGVTRLEGEEVALDDALGRVLAQDAVAPNDLPPFDSSGMDGFAVIASDTNDAPVALRIIGEARAGPLAPDPVTHGTAIRVSTGAVIPEGADAVVRQELTEIEDGAVIVNEEVAAGNDVRYAGEDIPAGETILHAGTLLGAAEIGALAAVNIARPGRRAPAADRARQHRRRARLARARARARPDPRRQRARADRRDPRGRRRDPHERARRRRPRGDRRDARRARWRAPTSSSPSAACRSARTTTCARRSSSSAPSRSSAA